MIVHGYYDSDRHQRDLRLLERQLYDISVRERMMPRRHSGNGLFRYRQMHERFEADQCEHRGERWTLAGELSEY
jgi:hypothetical protein